MGHLDAGLDSATTMVRPVLVGGERRPYRLTGAIHELVVDASNDLISDAEAEIQPLMAQP